MTILNNFWLNNSTYPSRCPLISPLTSPSTATPTTPLHAPMKPQTHQEWATGPRAEVTITTRRTIASAVKLKCAPRSRLVQSNTMATAEVLCIVRDGEWIITGATFYHREKIKALGAQWNPVTKEWRVSEKTDISPLIEYLSSPRSRCWRCRSGRSCSPCGRRERIARCWTGD